MRCRRRIVTASEASETRTRPIAPSSGMAGSPSPAERADGPPGAEAPVRAPGPDESPAGARFTAAGGRGWIARSKIADDDDPGWVIDCDDGGSGRRFELDVARCTQGVADDERTGDVGRRPRRTKQPRSRRRAEPIVGQGLDESADPDGLSDVPDRATRSSRAARSSARAGPPTGGVHLKGASPPDARAARTGRAAPSSAGATDGDVARRSRNDREPPVRRRRVGPADDPDTVAVRPATSAAAGIPAPARPTIGIRVPPTRSSAVQRSPDRWTSDEVASDADQPPFVRRAGRDPKLERRTRGRAEATDRGGPDPRRSIGPADLAGDADPRRRRPARLAPPAGGPRSRRSDPETITRRFVASSREAAVVTDPSIVSVPLPARIAAAIVSDRSPVRGGLKPARARRRRARRRGHRRAARCRRTAEPDPIAVGRILAAGPLSRRCRSGGDVRRCATELVDSPADARPRSGPGHARSPR